MEEFEQRIVLTKSNAAEIDVIRSNVKNYYQAYINLVNTGQVGDLAKYTFSHVYEMTVSTLKLDALYDPSLKYPPLELVQYVSFFSDSVAISGVRFEGGYLETIVLHKINGSWLIYEEKHDYWEENIKENNEFIKELKAKNEIVALTRKFQTEAIDYLRNGNTEKLKLILTDSAFKYIEIFKNKLVKFNPNKLKLHGFIDSLSTYHYSAYTNTEFTTGVFLAGRLALVYVRINGSWMLNNIAEPNEKQFDFNIEQSFESLKRLFDFEYDEYFVQNPPISPNLVATEKKNKVIHNIINDYDYIPPQFKGGFEAELAYIKNNLIYPEKSENTAKQDTVFVQFIVE